MLSLQQKANPFRRNHLIRDAIGQALHDAMGQDERIHLFGEGCEVKVHYDHPDIERDFFDRCHTMPIAEDGIVNFAVGAALNGYIPVVDIISSDFLYRAMDSICNTAAKVNFSCPDRPITMVIRAEFLTGGPTTGQRNEALFTHIPGLNVVIPSTPRDAYGLMRAALNTQGVTLFFEDRDIQDDGFFLKEDRVYPNEQYHVGFGEALWRNMGPRGGVTVVTYGVMRQRVEAILRGTSPLRWDCYNEESLDCGLIDLRSIYPIDWELLRRAIDRTGNLLIVEPDVAYGGVGAEIAAWAAECHPGVRIRRLGDWRTITPACARLRDTWPTEQEIVDAIRSLRNA